MAKIKGIVRVKGGSGSGNWGHTGRPGLVGGSGGGAGAAKIAQGVIPSGSSLEDVVGMLKKDGWDTGTLYGESAIGKANVKGDGVTISAEVDDYKEKWSVRLNMRTKFNEVVTKDAGSLRITPEQAHDMLTSDRWSD